MKCRLTPVSLAGSRTLSDGDTRIAAVPGHGRMALPLRQGQTDPKQHEGEGGKIGMKKRIFAWALSICMMISLLPGTALAVDGTEPAITDMSISYSGSAVDKTVIDGSFVFTAPANSDVVDYTAALTLSDGAAFTATTSPGEGDLYVASASENTATLKFNVTVNNINMANMDDFDLILTSSDGTVWTGGFSNAADLTLEALADYLVNQNLQLAAGALGTGSPAQDIVVNADDANVMLVLCAPDAVVYTVSYVVNDTTIIWKLPAGAAIPEITVNLTDGQEIEGWYTDSEHYTEFVPGTTVTGNTTLYANVTGGTTPPVTDNFYTNLIAGNTATIMNLDDWETFVEYADQADAGQLIVLGTDISCNNATYDPLEFAGNFDGGNHTISNATFRAVNTSSGDTCSGMFAKIGPGQVVANLTLQNVTAQYSGTYAGVLAGMVDGASNNRALIQNIQVTGSSASGRTAAGVVGFTRNVDVKFCSSRDTTITGLANGGGVVGINNAHVEYCYSTSSPTALPTLFGGSAGGVIAKNVRGGNNDYCWAYMTVVGAEDDGPGQNLHSFVADENMDSFDFEDEGFDQACWMEGNNTPVDFDPDVVTYNF